MVIFTQIFRYLFISCLLCSVSKAEEWLAVTEEFPPYNYTSEGEAYGYATEIVKAMAEHLNITIPIRYLPWSRAMQVANTQSNVLIFSILRTKERENKYHWIGEIDDMTLYIWQLRDNPGLLAKPPDEITYAAIRTLDKNISNLLSGSSITQASNIVTVEKSEQMVGMLLKKRVDRILLAERAWYGMTGTFEVSELQRLEPVELVLSNELTIAASLKTDPNSIIKLEQAFVEVMASERIKTAKNKYLTKF